MSAHIRYAYLKGYTWLYRRNYPVDVALALGTQALMQSLKTGDRNTARVRAAEVNARFETLVEQVRSQAEDVLSAPENTADVPDWIDQPESSLVRLRATLEDSGCNLERSKFIRPSSPVKVPVRDLSRAYLNKRSNEL
ncbi:DUF6538 domain-containing protein [Ruegeria atlantica]|uniref:DUF6538 domain-containing protein n=1 Tax=Ruegeria atlantica TaxID=81569 RepID=UPI0020C49609|nr:DUF6538 domain-containing protein [Ruegeria atlantica]